MPQRLRPFFEPLILSVASVTRVFTVGFCNSSSRDVCPFFQCTLSLTVTEMTVTYRRTMRRQLASQKRESKRTDGSG